MSYLLLDERQKNIRVRDPVVAMMTFRASIAQRKPSPAWLHIPKAVFVWEHNTA
jgi:hypothetical protein